MLKRIAFTAICALLLSAGPCPAKNNTLPDIVPYPASLSLTKGSFNVKGAAINCDSSLDGESLAAVGKLAGALTLTTGKTVAVASTAGLQRTVASGKAKGLAFWRDPSLGAEAYRIEITPRYVSVSASDRNGFLYAIQTLKQMMPLEVYGRKPAAAASWKIPCAVIEDKPQYGWRGMHLDCSRHFFPVREVKRYLDLMAIYKMNRFHWHLTDDQGWRIELKSYPELTQIGAFRDGSQVSHDENDIDDVRHGGYYTQAQIRDVVDYAEKLGITVVPEVDLPGHMQAVLATYPHLGCTGGPYEVRKQWGVSEDVLCGGKDSSYEFLKNMLEEVADLFPGEYFHIGGDECPKVRWEQCPDCQAKIRALGLKGDPTRKNAGPEWALQTYITGFVSEVLAAKGKKIIGWDEVLYGGANGNETIMSWLGMKHAVRAVQQGLHIIACPHPLCYYNYYQAKPKDQEPLAIGGYLPLEKAYNFNPMADIPAEYSHLVDGVQANLWGEYLVSEEVLEYQLLPRMLAASEVEWRDPALKDYQDFRRRVIARHLPLLELLGYNYCKAVLEK